MMKPSLDNHLTSNYRSRIHLKNLSSPFPLSPGLPWTLCIPLCQQNCSWQGHQIFLLPSAVKSTALVVGVASSFFWRLLSRCSWIPASVTQRGKGAGANLLFYWGLSTWPKEAVCTHSPNLIPTSRETAPEPVSSRCYPCSFEVFRVASPFLPHVQWPFLLSNVLLPLPDPHLKCPVHPSFSTADVLAPTFSLQN